MELDQEKLTRNESERSRELAQRIRRELGPCSVQVLGGVGALESALEATGAVQPAEGALPELLVVVDPEWVTLPQQLADRVLLVCSEETMLAACAKQLANLIRGMGAHVNLIPINPVDGSPYSATDAANVRRFQQKLESLGVNATVRRRLGSEISAACGQLRRDEMNGKA